MPSTTPTTLPLAWSTCVRKIGRMGQSISEEISANRLAAARRTVFLEVPAGYRVRVAAIMNRPGTGFAIEDFQPLHVKRAIENGRRNRVRHLKSPFRRVNCTFVGVRQSPSPHG